MGGGRAPTVRGGEMTEPERLVKLATTAFLREMVKVRQARLNVVNTELALRGEKRNSDHQRLESAGLCTGWVSEEEFCGGELPCDEHAYSVASMARRIGQGEDPLEVLKSIGLPKEGNGPWIDKKDVAQIIEHGSVLGAMVRCVNPSCGHDEFDHAEEKTSTRCMKTSCPCRKFERVNSYSVKDIKVFEAHKRINLLLNELSSKAGENKQRLLHWLEHAKKSVELEIKCVNTNIEKGKK